MEDTERSNRVIKTAINGTQITFSVRDCETITFDATKVSAANRAYAEMHGWKQRLVDDAAGEKDCASKHAAIKGLVDYYESGAETWSAKRVTKELTTEQKLALYEKLKAELGI